MTVNRMVYIADDKSLQIDGITLFDTNIEWVPDNIHAVQWYGDEYGGQVEYKTEGGPFGFKPQNDQITELGIWEGLITYFNEERQRRIDLEIAAQQAQEASRDYWQELRNIRNYLLSQSDWTQLADIILTQEQKDLWVIYRQQLRNLPENITDPKPMVLSHYSGETHPDWPVPPQ